VWFDGSQVSERVYCGREDGVMGSLEARRVAKGDRTRFWQAVIVDLFFGGSAWWDSSCPAASLQAGIDARGTRGDFQRRRSQPVDPNGDRRGHIKDIVSIRQRPAAVEDRAVPGHWEGDLLSGPNNSYIATLVERHTRYVMLAKVAGKDTRTVVSALIKQAKKLPKELYKSLTWDRGKELTDHRRFTLATNIDVYFCDPQSPWQRGSNENTNGLLRQYFPKGTDLSVHSQAYLNKVARQLSSCNGAGLAEVEELAKAAVGQIKTGDPRNQQTTVGPMVSQKQWDRVQRYIRIGIDEGTLLAGGEGRPDGLDGWFVRPTLFTNVRNDMTIAREEIFGPVLSIIPYEEDEEAIAIANDTVYGLQAYVLSGNMDRARRVADRIFAGRVLINTLAHEPMAPFGGFKQSGIGREYGDFGMEAFLEPKSLLGLYTA
jgi:hypothetical protein